MAKFNKTLNIILTFICLISGIAAQDDAYEEANKQLNFLNSENFKSSISNGIWMVFFGASWCPHCRHLTPDWLIFQQEANEKELETQFDFHIAKVECTESEDICREQGLRGYPTIILFNNGEKKGETNDRKPELLMNFAQKNIDTYYPENLKYGYKRLSDEKLTAELSKVVPLEIGEKTRNINPEGKIVHLTDETIESMFHVPWCGHCQRFGPTWEEFAGMMKNKMNIGKVDCTAYADICSKYGVTHYPTLKIIDKHEVNEFKGIRRIEDLEKFVERYISSSISVSKAETIRGDMKNNEVLFFLYYNYAEPNVEEIKLFIDIVSELNVLSAKVYLTPDEELMNSFNIEQGTTGIVVSRDYGKGFYKFEGKFTKEELKPWIEKYMYPFVIEITPLNSETYLNSKNYVVMGIFPTSDIKSPIYDNIRIASRAWAAQHEVDPTLRYSDKYIHTDFVWLDGSKFSKYVKSTFGINIAELPRVIILNPSNGKYYDKGVSGKYLHDENISVSLSAALNQQLKAKNIKGGYFSTLKDNTPIQVILIIVVILFAVLIYLIFFNNKKKEVEYYLPVKMENKQA
ncbi:thioredoxin-like protein [Neocallimastix lanati (nom. inval.)]|uniref:Thioredoxin-like protein n=1 Tax=Neocallimastix californiae TaxID=1754190 RepID=A0A1Y2FTS9_9FUNG|nr:thioredoxin-like protein [Neocallimastix sp. JGI-2020a]ORY86596.1 thioredoxin-like protein [Neocallimastix californiae]|eukprot:ORY86596.1 thioredoxin-like protein [Neocallimastix californiae]